MTKLVSDVKLGRSLWIGLILVLVLTACSGNTPTNINIQDAASAVMNAEAVQAAQGQGYLPAEASQSPAEAPMAAKAFSGSGALQQPVQPGQQPVDPGPGPSAQAPGLGLQAAALQAAAPAAVVDLSLPVEPRVGARAPEISLQTLDGGTVRLSDLLGRPVVVSYWTTWCIPCKQELPILEKLHQEYQDQGLVVLTVNALDQDDLASVQAMAQELGMTFPVLLDGDKAFASAYNAMFFPSTYYIGPDGVIREIKLGDSTEADLRAKVQSLLAGGQ